MDNTDRASLRCPWCAYTLSEKELQSGLCDRCGKEFDVDQLIVKQRELSNQEGNDRRAIVAEWLGATFGVLMIAAGIAGVCFSQVGPAQLLSRWGVASIIVTITAVIHHRINEWPMYRILLGCGFVWLILGIAMSKFL